jgi:tetratricopeptide (TPR) repeat protein
MERPAEALRANQLARELDPLSLVPRLNEGRLAHLGRRYERVVQEMRAVLELDSDQPWAHAYMAMAYAELGKHREAAEHAAQSRAISEGRPGLPEAYCAARAGRKQEARSILAYWKQRRKEANVDPMFLAGVHAALGERDDAVTMVELAYAERSSFLPYARVHPWLESMRDDSRFAELLRRLKLPPVAP